MEEPLLTLAELSRQTGIAYHRIVHAHKTGAVPEPRRVGNHRVYGPAAAAVVVAHFEAQEKGRRPPRRRGEAS